MKTLATFNFGGSPLQARELAFLRAPREVVLPFLFDHDDRIREQACLACARLLLPPSSSSFIRLGAKGTTDPTSNIEDDYQNMYAGAPRTYSVEMTENPSPADELNVKQVMPRCTAVLMIDSLFFEKIQ